MLDNKCPNCGEKLSPFYLKQECPKCKTNLLYFDLENRLEADRIQAEKEVNAVNDFIDMLKSSTIKTPVHIIRLILMFTPLASMCLPMLWAGHKNISLITIIMSIINHGFDFGALTADKSYLFALLSVVLVIILSIVEIICSLFSAKKNGFARNIISWSINFAVLLATAKLACVNGAVVKAGLIVTIIIYIIKAVLHCVIGNMGAKTIIALAVSVIIPSALFFNCIKAPEASEINVIKATEQQVSIVSFNVASAFGTALEDTDSMTRCSRFADYISKTNPDFIGTQEINEYWMDELKALIPDYEGYGVVRGGDSEKSNSEMNSVFWVKDKYELISKNTIWLSETPETESKYSYIDDEGNEAEAGCNRICTYVILKNAEGKLYAVMNTHLDNSSEQARLFGANVVLKLIDEIKAEFINIEIVLTGDFNETQDDEAVILLSSKLNRCGADKAPETATYQEWGYRSTGTMPIDFIFSSNSCQHYEILNNIDNGYVSDHYGIYAIVEK